MSILDELYRGKINPSAQRFDNDSKYSELAQTVAAIEMKLLNRLEGEEKELFIKLMDAQKNIREIGEDKRFIQGYQLGARIMLDTFSIP